jgi:Ca-activated chloride channel family protein
MTEFLGIYWAGLNRLFLLPLFAITIFLFLKNYKKTKLVVSALVHSTNRKKIFLHFSPAKQSIKLLAYIAALFFLFIALLQPQWHKKEQVIQQEGRDLLILLDISRSMMAQDLKPNRLDFIKLKLRALLNKLKFERVGLILFSGSAFVQCPLTTDYSTFLMFLDQVDVESIASGTTAIDSALKKSISTYKQYPDHKNKLALLITDGEDFSLNLKTVKQQAKQENIKIFALGAATKDGAPIPKIDIHGKQIGHETDEKGGIAMSKLNEKLLRDLCKTLDGNYVGATYDDSDLDYIVRLINKFEKEKLGDKKLSLYEDQYPWFLGISWFLFALGWVV